MVSLRTPTLGNFYYLYDGVGNTVAVTNNTGAVTHTYDYDPYGELRSSTEAWAQPFRFGGAYGGFTDVTMGLVKIGHRYYDPQLGRWTQLDPMGGGYVYVGCNPTNSVDPSGLEECNPAQLAVGAGIVILTDVGIAIPLNVAAFGSMFIPGYLLASPALITAVEIIDLGIILPLNIIGFMTMRESHCVQF